MKKLISTMLVVAAMLTTGTAKADNITLEQAKEAAAFYLGHKAGFEKLSAADLELIYRIDNLDLDVPAMYFFQASCGWIIMAGTTVNNPVVAYSIENSTLDMSDISPSMWWWLNSYANDIREVQAMDAENDYPDCDEWQNIVNHKGVSKAEQVILLHSEWDQGKTRKPTYNLYCPKASSGRYSVVGCVATALSQMCYYYRYPGSPKKEASTWYGSTLLKVNLDTVTYDYNLMLDKLPYVVDSSVIKETASLCYHVGLAVKMQYDPDGSGTTHGSAKSGMVKYFKYQIPTLVYRQGTDDTSFVNSVRRELVKKNVVYMGGRSSTGGGVDADGHAWLVTGYEVDNQSYMYFNWGWGGPSSGDAFYNLRTNNMRITGQGYNFDTDQTILLGLEPPADSNIHRGGGPVAIAEVEDNTILGSAYPNPATLSVTLPYNADRASELNIYSIDGRLVATHHVQAGAGSVEVKVSGMPAGIYIYRLNSKSGKFVVR